MTGEHKQTSDEIRQLYARFRVMAWTGVVAILLVALLWWLLPVYRPYTGGLFIGQLGGAYVVYSMIRQGHLRDETGGTALFASGMLGLFTRLIVLVLVIVAAEKLPRVNVYAALVGYLLGFVWIIVGIYGFAKRRGTIAGEER
jgi:hypothetical protein